MINSLLCPPIVKEGKKICVIDPADVVHEASNWNSSMICIVLGAKPPLQVFKGFVRRIWNSFGIDKVLRLENDHFIVRFNDEATRDVIVSHGIWFFFYKKPLVVQALTGDNDALAGVCSVPIWVKFPSLLVRY